MLTQLTLQEASFVLNCDVDNPWQVGLLVGNMQHVAQTGMDFSNCRLHFTNLLS